MKLLFALIVALFAAALIVKSFTIAAQAFAPVAAALSEGGR